MVELQEHTERFEAAGVALYAISYDETDALTDFARAYGITFPLLSDPGSEIIKRFGILNTLIGTDEHPWYGIPFPGTYVIDADGIVTAKYFESSLFLRASADTLLRAARGEEVEPEVATTPADATAPSEITFEVTYDGEVARAGVLRDLIVRFEVPDGFHLYGEPVPEGMVATSIELDEMPGLLVREATLPPTLVHRLDGTGETLHVFEGRVEIRLPIAHFGRPLVERDGGERVLALTGTVRWQACDDHTCQLPRSESFQIEIPGVGYNSMSTDLGRSDGMDVVSHFVAMTAQRTDKSIGDIMRELGAD